MHNVSSTPTSNRVDGSLVLLHDAVALQLLVEAEHCALAKEVGVAGAAAAAKETGGGLRDDGGGRGRERSGLEAVVVSGAAAARVVKAAGGVERGAFSDDGHCDCVWSCEVWLRMRSRLGAR